MATLLFLTALTAAPPAAQPDAIAPPPPVVGFSQADYARHARLLNERVPPGFTVILQPPFFVIGDEDPATVKRRAEGTVAWAVRLLKRDYFAKDPRHIIDIWLFEDAASYVEHTWSIFRDRPDTPFGYYSETEKALIMNIETGGGTLVHEIVHPFVDANFPAAPAWLNEGLGSMYEQCAERDGHIRGLTNWRLAGLQDAIRAGELPTFRQLTHTTVRQFYDEDPGSNYAQARYLLYYLQEQGTLRRFYRQFRRDHRADPSGYQTLQAILGTKDVTAFQATWERWVLGLKFPPST